MEQKRKGEEGHRVQIMVKSCRVSKPIALTRRNLRLMDRSAGVTGNEALRMKVMNGAL